MDKFAQYRRYNFHNHNNEGPKFVFPTTESQPNLTEKINDIVKSVKEVVASIPTTQAPENLPQTEIATATTPILDLSETTANNSFIQTVNNTLEEMFDSNSTTSVATLDIMQNSTSLTNASNGTVVNVSGIITQETTSTIQEIMMSTTEAMTSEQYPSLVATENITNITEKTPIDWLNHDANEFMNHNLTMIHNEFNNHDQDQTLYIVLGVILGVLVAIGFILLMIYISYRRSNLYILQEQASRSSCNQRVLSKVSTSTVKDQDFEQALEYDKNCYKF